jgi:PEP-CTERM motif
MTLTRLNPLLTLWQWENIVNHKIVIAVLVSAGLFAGASNASELVTNGTFSGCTGQTCTGWTVTPATTGSHFFFANGTAYFGATGGLDDTISQNLATVSGNPYTVSFNLVMPFPGPNNDSDFFANFGGTQMLALTSGQAGTWNYSSTETASSANSLLSFSGQNSAYYNFLRNVSVQGVQGVVPEPSTYAMLLAGLGLIGFIAYRRKDDSSDMPMAA